MRTPKGKVESWVLNHQGTFIVALCVVVAALVPLSVWLVVDDVKQGGQLRGVGVAGPCRAFGIRNDECQKQSRRIFAACYIQHEECWDKYGLPDLIRRSVNPLKAVPKYGIPDRGGDALQTGSTGHQQPSPSPSGGGGTGTEAGKGGGHGSPAPGSGGSGGPSAPAGGGSDPAPAPASGGSGGQQSSAQPESDLIGDEEAHQVNSPSLLPETVEAAGGAVGETGEAAQGAIEAVGDTAKCVLKGAC
jgi:hypothetical protein